MDPVLDGKLRHEGDRYEVCFERHFDAPVERMWAAISEPALMEGWLGGPVDKIELAEGGNVVIQIHPKGPATVYGKITRFEPLKVLELTWDVPAWRQIPDFFGSVMRWEVRPDATGSTFSLTHSLREDTLWHVYAMLGAWHLHLDQMPATLAGSPIPSFGEEDFFAMRDRYSDLIGPLAPISREYEHMVLPVPGVWVIDTMHSNLTFECRHLMMTPLRGWFTEFSGDFHVAEVPEESWVEVNIDAPSLRMASQIIEDAVKGEHYMQADQFKTLHFKSTRARHVEANLWQVAGDLTVKDTTREVVLDATFEGVLPTPPHFGGRAKMGFTATTEFDRRDFGLEANVPVPGGGWLVGNRVVLHLSAEAALW
jgi:polyisoprenoid-binding protein YceI/uncharacterized protein YndB with AHSA1/START domain